MADTPQSNYLQYLPALFHEQPFVGAFLLAFESILAGQGSASDSIEGYDEILDRIDTFFAPQPVSSTSHAALPLDKRQTPSEFLPWLAQWVAISLRDDWSEETKRNFISRIVPLYQKRGTKDGLEELLKLYTNESVEIYELAAPPHYFQVIITLSEADPEKLNHKQRIARALINQEKPAHTFYALQVQIPAMRIINSPATGEEGLILGENTILGNK